MNEIIEELVKQIAALEKRLEYMETVEKNVFSTATVEGLTNSRQFGQQANKAIPDDSATAAFTLTKVGAGSAVGTFLVALSGSVGTSVFSAGYVLSLAYDDATMNRDALADVGMTSVTATAALASGVCTITLTIDNDDGGNMTTYCQVIPMGCWGTDYWTLAAL